MIHDSLTCGFVRETWTVTGVTTINILTRQIPVSVFPLPVGVYRTSDYRYLPSLLSKVIRYGKTFESPRFWVVSSRMNVPISIPGSIPSNWFIYSTPPVFPTEVEETLSSSVCSSNYRGLVTQISPGRTQYKDK